MKKRYQFISYILILTMVLSFVPITKEDFVTFAEEITATDEEELLDSGICGENLTYKLTTDGTLTISGSGEMTSNGWIRYADKIKKIIIGDQVSNVMKKAFYSVSVRDVEMGASVTEIGESAFAYCSMMNTIKLSANLRIIQDSAFCTCNNLKELSLPEGLEKIEQFAFYQCYKLKKVVVPDSVTKIGNYVFTDCKELTDVEMSNNIIDFGTDVFKSTPYYEWIFNWENGMFYCGNILVAFNEDCSENIEIKEGTRVIADSPNKGCDIKTINFPDSLIKIGSKAFSGCKQITVIDFPQNLVEIGSFAFYDCENISEIVLPNSLVEIGESAFAHCYYLEQIKLPDSLVEIGAKAFVDSSRITTVIIPPNVKKISKETFDNWFLVNITILSRNVEIEEIGNPSGIIYGYSNSTAQEYALKTGMRFVAIDEEETPIAPPQTTEWDTSTTSSETEPDATSEGNSETLQITPTKDITEPTKESPTPEDVETSPVVSTKDVTESIITEPNISTTNRIEITTIEPNVTQVTTTSDMIQTTISSVKQTTKPDINDKTLKPAIKKVKEKNWHTVKITWKRISGIKKYTLYRSKKKSGKYKKIVTTSKRSFLDKKVKAGTKYYYKIKVTSSGKEAFLSKTKMIRVKGTPNKPKIKLDVNGRLWQIHWGIISDNSTGIEIYMKNGEGKFKKFTRINQTVNIKKNKKKKGATGIQSSVDSLKKGLTYQFKARTYTKVKGKKVYSKWSKTIHYTRK